MSVFWKFAHIVQAKHCLLECIAGHQHFANVAAGSQPRMKIQHCFCTDPKDEAKQAVASPIDAAGSASAVLLRDIHCALLRAIEGPQGLQRDKPQPTQARLLSPDSAGPVPWTANVARMLLSAPATKAAVPAKVTQSFKLASVT